MRRSANKATCDMWIMRHKLRLRSKLACFEFKKKVCSTRANLYTLSVENPRALISREGAGGGQGRILPLISHLYQCSISANGECPVEQNVQLKRIKKKRTVEARVRKAAAFFFWRSLSVLRQKSIDSNSISAMYTSRSNSH